MHALGADTGAVTGPATILHQPETANHKRHPAHPVRLEQHTGERHAAAAIAGELPDPPRPTAAARSRSAGPRRARSNDPLLALAPAVYVRALTGLTPGRAGKLSCPFHELSVGEATADGVSPARSVEDASSSGRGAASDPLLMVPPPVYFERLTGLRVGPSGKLHCLFHDDRSPSLHVYPEPERGWFCFGCRRGGSVYDLAALLFGLGTRGRDFVELRRELERRLLPLRQVSHSTRGWTP